MHFEFYPQVIRWGPVNSDCTHSACGPCGPWVPLLFLRDWGVGGGGRGREVRCTATLAPCMLECVFGIASQCNRECSRGSKTGTVCHIAYAASMLMFPERQSSRSGGKLPTWDHAKVCSWDELGWCMHVISTHGAWRHAGAQFLLPSVLNFSLIKLFVWVVCRTDCLFFLICACHPCAGAMLIFSLSFKF